MRLNELLTEANLTVPAMKEWLHSGNIEHGMDQVEEVMNGNAFIKSLPMPLTVYRGLHIEDPQEWIKNLVRGVGRDLGVSWTHDFHASINENGPEGGYGRPMDGPTNVVLVAIVENDAVDWYATTALMAIDEEEPEIRLHRGANVHLVEVKLLNFSNHDWTERVEEHHVTRSISLNMKLRA